MAQERQPRFPGSDIRCDLERVDVVVTTDPRFTPKIFWSDAVFGTNGNAKLLMEDRDGRPLDIALIEIREDQVWIMRAEPTLDNRVGITIQPDVVRAHLRRRPRREPGGIPGLLCS